MPDDYQYVYNVNLLDDLHNYFPAILYDGDRFQSTRDLLRYVREQTHNRFNLFSYGARLHNQSQEQEQPTTPPIPQTPIASVQPIQVRSNESAMESMATTNLLLGLLGASMDTTPTLGSRLLQRVMLNPNADVFVPTRSFLQPVVVRPTENQIENNSEIVTDISGQSCAVCQDLIRPEETCRRLRACRHIYHRTCIDQWFLRSVFCPTCRHDIRDRQPTEWGL